MNRRQFLQSVGSGVLGGIALSLGACGNTPQTDEAETTDSDTQAPSQGSSLPLVEWRLTTSWTENLDIILGGATIIAERVAAMTDGRFQIQVFPAGEIAPALGVLESVQNGTVECGHTASFYFVDQNESLGISTGLPFGLTPQQQNAWLYYGGGVEAIRKVYSDFGIINFPAGGTGTQMGGWLRQEVNSLKDLTRTKFRIPGLGGKVMERLGVKTMVVSSSEIFESLKSGDIDAAEWIGPYDDEKLGLNKVAPYYYYPGWWEPGSTLDVLVNRQAWDKLPTSYQQIFEAATYQANISMLSRYEQENKEALVRLIAAGVQLRAYSNDIMDAASIASFELYEEIAASNPSFKEIFRPWKEFRKQIYQWNRFNEMSFALFATNNL